MLGGGNKLGGGGSAEVKLVARKAGGRAGGGGARRTLWVAICGPEERVPRGGGGKLTGRASDGGEIGVSGREGAGLVGEGGGAGRTVRAAMAGAVEGLSKGGGGKSTEKTADGGESVDSERRGAGPVEKGGGAGRTAPVAVAAGVVEITPRGGGGKSLERAAHGGENVESGAGLVGEGVGVAISSEGGGTRLELGRGNWLVEQWYSQQVGGWLGLHYYQLGQTLDLGTGGQCKPERQKEGGWMGDLCLGWTQMGIEVGKLLRIRQCWEGEYQKEEKEMMMRGFQ
ncbi:hypothetical protein KFL_007240010 [Klebsormidium nitens]|uniref:Uncharacterized protein n=1 Tax=Klebsormidium nitens TaxID=105231 RepID=A0A1Y1IJV4_KLENI|nr:hypothetical protein KFL_007240010 [Klebsormidium nitens]|eukprot:GAQ91074.1 hypothetical protein KFL_007240010 [Klebsormidium nitens]